jgi:two-component system sensor histidine kinase MprB
MTLALSLRSRLALSFGVLAFAVSAFVSVSAFRSTSTELAASTDSFLEQRAADISSGLRTSPEGRRPRPGTESGSGLPFDPDSIVQALDRQGNVTGASGGDLPISATTQNLLAGPPTRSSSQSSHFEDIAIDGESYRMYVQALPQGGAVQVARSTVEDDAVLTGLIRRFLLIGAGVSLLAALAGWWVARQATQPLRRLMHVASAVADTGDFSTPVPVDRSDEIGELAGSFQKMLLSLETSRAQQHRLVHDAGHELRTPLTSLRANVALLERARELPPGEQSEVLTAIRSELQELTNLFDELMQLATDNHDADAPFEQCDLSDIVARTVERWQHRTSRTIEVSASSSIVNGNVAMLERAIANLLGNANKFSPPDTSIEIVVSDGTVVVRDKGPGIPVADRERVFDRFYRTDVTRSMPGSGLGLAIVAQIVERHGGSVWAREAPAGGAEVGFRLPI